MTSRIIVAFARNASREKICQLVEQCGYELRGSFRSGAEVLRAIHKMGGGVIISGYKLADMTVDELANNLDGMGQILVAASPMNLELVETPRALRVPSPISRVAFREALDTLLDRDSRQQHSRISQRTPEETALINHAKALLIARGMTEAEAHSALQQRSMRNRCRLTETAQQIIVAYDINART